MLGRSRSSSELDEVSLLILVPRSGVEIEERGIEFLKS